MRARYAAAVAAVLLSSCGAGTVPHDGAPFAPAARADGGPIVWIAPDMVRIAPNAAPSPGPIDLVAARNQVVSLQLAVAAPRSAGLTHVDLSISPFRSAGGASTRIESALYREWYVRVTKASPVSGHPRSLGPGLYPDGLIPFVDDATGKPPRPSRLRAEPASIAAGTTQPYWIDLRVPRDTIPGTYRATVTLTSSQGSATQPVALSVLHVTMPLAPTTDSDFQLQYSRDSAQLASQTELLRNRVQPVPVNAPDERALAHTYGLKMASLAFWGGAYYGHCTLSPPPSVAAIARAVRAQHVPTIYDQPADEIGSCKNLKSVMVPLLQHWARNLHANGVLDLVTMAPIPALETDGTASGRSAVDIWTMLPIEFVHATAQIRNVLAKGDRTWWYTALSQDDFSPKWEVDVPPGDYRIESLIDENLNLTGEEYWAVDAWRYVKGGDPWNDIESNQGGTLYAGEGILAYPGTDVGTAGDAPSMRLKWIRDGMYDADAVSLLKACGLSAWAHAQTQAIAADFHHWTDDANAIATVSRRLLQRLDASCPN